MNNDSLFLLKIRLRADERDALIELSRCERRDTRAQAAILIRRALESAGYLKNESAPAQSAPFPTAARQTDTAPRGEGVKHAATN